MLNQQKYSDILAATFHQWRAFEEVKKLLMSNGYGFEIRSPNKVTVYKSDHEVNQLIELAATRAKNRGHNLEKWKKSDDLVWASSVCHACGAQAVVSLDPIFDESISGNALTTLCC